MKNLLSFFFLLASQNLLSAAQVASDSTDEKNNVGKKLNIKQIKEKIVPIENVLNFLQENQKNAEKMQNWLNKKHTNTTYDMKERCEMQTAITKLLPKLNDALKLYEIVKQEENMQSFHKFQDYVSEIENSEEYQTFQKYYNKYKTKMNKKKSTKSFFSSKNIGKINSDFLASKKKTKKNKGKLAESFETKRSKSKKQPDIINDNPFLQNRNGRTAMPIEQS